MHAQRLLLLGLLSQAPGISAGSRDGPGRRRPVRFRWLMILLAVGVALDLAISAALIYNNRQIARVTSEAHIAKVASYEACVASNRSKQADHDRWEKVLALIDTMPKSPQIQQFVSGVRAANATADHPADCTPLVP
jgi:hypothetical protein